MDKTPLSNEELVELLGSLGLHQIKGLPQEFEHRELPSFKDLMELVRERLAMQLSIVSLIDDDSQLSRKQQRDLATDLKHEMQGKPIEKQTRDFLAGYENYRFTKDFLRGTYLTHKAQTDLQRIGCITVRLERFIPPGSGSLAGMVESVLAGIGAVLNVMVRHGQWPIEVEDPKHIFWLIHKQLLAMAHPAVFQGENLMLVLGQPRNLMDHIPFVNKEELVALADQMKEVGQEYPGWIIQSDPDEQSL